MFLPCAGNNIESRIALWKWEGGTSSSFAKILLDCGSPFLFIFVKVRKISGKSCVWPEITRRGAMKARVAGCLVSFLSLMIVLTMSARPSWADKEDDHNGGARLKLLGTIAIPGNPIASTDIADINQNTETLYFSDRSNLAVDVVDAENDLYIGRITTNAGGTLHFAGLTSPSTHEGPNGVVSTADKKVWAADGDSTVKVLDVDPSSPTYLQIIASVNLAGLSAVSACTGGPAGTCNRADEIAYDPSDHIIMVIDDEPTSIQPFATFIDSNFPYTVLGQINFAAQGLVASKGLEQPAWDPQLHRFLQTLPSVNATGTGAIAVINPKTLVVDRVISLAGYDCSPSGEALGADQHLVVACGIVGAAAPSPTSFPLVIDVTTGSELGAGINQVGGGDEVNYDPGDNEFVVSSNVAGIGTNPDVLGVINGRTGDWLENAPAATEGVGTTLGTGGLATTGRAGNLAALGENDHVFVIVHPAAAPGTDICGTFGTVDYGCVAVFGPEQEDPDGR